MKLTYPTFEDYLGKVCFDELDVPRKDIWDEQFDLWLSRLDGEEYEQLANDWGKTIINDFQK